MQTRRPLINGKHRKQTNPIKGRVAFVAAATGVVSTAGATGAAIAHTTDTGISEISLAAEDTPNAEEGAPQILDIAEFKPVSNLQDQLNKAVQYSNDLAKADEEARKPKISVSRPTDGILTSGYGMRWGSLHAGVDLANAIGTPILAVMDGTVIDSGPASGYGNWIRIKHDDGSMSVYGQPSTSRSASASRPVRRLRAWATGVSLPARTYTLKFTPMAMPPSTRCPGSTSMALASRSA